MTFKAPVAAAPEPAHARHRCKAWPIMPPDFKQGRSIMKAFLFGAAAAALVAGTIAASAQTPSWTPPSPSQRCPSKWDASDERGSGNPQKPQTVLNAARLINTGEVSELGHVIEAGMPIQSTRRFEIFTKRTADYLA